MSGKIVLLLVADDIIIYAENATQLTNAKLEKKVNG